MKGSFSQKSLVIVMYQLLPEVNNLTNGAVTNLDPSVCFYSYLNFIYNGQQLQFSENLWYKETCEVQSKETNKVVAFKWCRS